MSVRALVEGWQASQMEPSERARLQRELDCVLDGSGLEHVLPEVHDAVRSSIRLHWQVHMVDLRVRWRSGVRLELVRQLPPMLLAPVSSLGRRLGGLDGTVPADPGLWTTWRRVWSQAVVPRRG